MSAELRGTAVVLWVMMFLSTHAAAAGFRDLQSDTWVAADALGRILPGHAKCGGRRPGKTVGIFYFIWHGQHGAGGPYDITKILAENPQSPRWGPPNALHHWGEPELGYYVADDEYVLRKHARMLANAGVDVIILDVTNGITYTSVYLKLCEVYRQLRREGLQTPQLCFITNSGHEKTVTTLYEDFYSKGLYPELWFRWLGKPLILSRSDGLSSEIRDFFTFRQTWAWSSTEWFGDGRNKWTWLDHYPQKPGWHVEGIPEEISVCVAQHPMTNIGRSFHGGKQPSPERFESDRGLCFAEQWERALEVDPAFVFITGWNEWVAQRFLSDGNQHLAGCKLPKGESYFVDQYNQEYSRDIEPMRGGHTDNYYYQMISYIRRYKGVRRPEPASAPVTIQIDGDFADWRNVRPEFRDHVGDTEHRRSAGWGSAGIYTNTTGRNDFELLKVARDRTSIYFYARTAEPITSHTDRNWMLLFIDADSDPSTGWHGYDYLINASVIDSTWTTLRKNLGGWRWSSGQRIPYRVCGNELELAVPRSALSLASDPLSFDFHWADNIQKPGEIIEFAVSGDSAPDRRFNYRYTSH